MIAIAKPQLDDREIAAVERVIRSGVIASGNEVKEFEKEFAAFNETKFAVAVSNGTAALHAAIAALNLNPGDKVVTTAFTFIASANSILMNNLVPVFVDVEEHSGNIDPTSIRRALEHDPDIKAVLVVHLYGYPCAMEEIYDICQQHHLYLIEDCAQAHGAQIQGRNVGTFGHVGAYSFYPTKNMTTSEGGMIVSNTPDYETHIRQFVNHGSSRRYFHEMLGYNFRMTDISAAIGRVQLSKLEIFNEIRRENAHYLNQELANVSYLSTPTEMPGVKSVYHQYTVKVLDGNREIFAQYLSESGIGYGIHYPTPIYRQPSFTKLGYPDLQLPVTEQLSNQVISLPVHPGLTREDLDYIVRMLKQYDGRGAL